MARRRHPSRPGEGTSHEAEGEGGPAPLAEGERVYLIDRERARALDSAAVGEFGLPTIVLMENAARHVADVALERAGEGARVLVVCGSGNNGGDGLACARHLTNAGMRVFVALTRGVEELRGDAGVHARAARAMGIPIRERATGTDLVGLSADVGGFDLVIDSLVGTGLTRDVSGAMGELIEGINQLRREGAEVLAVDVPSGLDCDRGVPMGAAVRADVTVTFVGLKPGFLALDAQEYVGEVIVVDIGAPHSLVARLARELSLPAGEPERASRPKRRRRPGGG